MTKLLSLQEVCKLLGITMHFLEYLIKRGVFEKCTSGVLEESLNFREGEHYVVCRECGIKGSEITGVHLQRCSGITLATYRSRYPEVATMSDIARKARVRTPEQRKAQSEKLKARFQTPEGMVTKQQISEASKRMQAGPYGARAAEHLRTINANEENRKRIGVRSKAFWDDGTQREKMAAWNAAHRDEVLASAAKARTYIKRTYSKPHRMLEEAMQPAGMLGFSREHVVHYYQIDEAFPEAKLAVEVDGCYWHGCPKCGFSAKPLNEHLDKRKTTYLVNRGWIVLRVRECEIHADVLACVERIQAALANLCSEVLSGT